jgi:hypothetical protein
MSDLAVVSARPPLILDVGARLLKIGRVGDARPIDVIPITHSSGLPAADGDGKGDDTEITRLTRRFYFTASGGRADGADVDDAQASVVYWEGLLRRCQQSVAFTGERVVLLTHVAARSSAHTHLIRTALMALGCRQVDVYNSSVYALNLAQRDSGVVLDIGLLGSRVVVVERGVVVSSSATSRGAGTVYRHMCRQLRARFKHGTMNVPEACMLSTAEDILGHRGYCQPASAESVRMAQQLTSSSCARTTMADGAHQPVGAVATAADDLYADAASADATNASLTSLTLTSAAVTADELDLDDSAVELRIGGGISPEVSVRDSVECLFQAEEEAQSSADGQPSRQAAGAEGVGLHELVAECLQASRAFARGGIDCAYFMVWGSVSDLPNLKQRIAVEALALLAVDFERRSRADPTARPAVSWRVAKALLSSAFSDVGPPYAPFSAPCAGVAGAASCPILLHGQPKTAPKKLKKTEALTDAATR